MLDPRLYPLLETLTRSDLDWLAQEVMSGALAGHVAEESSDALAQARSVAFREYQDTRELKPVVASLKRATPFSGEEQIAWAIAHVGDRIEQVLKMSLTSVDRLDALVDPDGKALGPVRGATLLAIVDDEDLIQVGRLQLAAGVEGLDAFRRALDSWASDSLDEEQP